MLAARLGAGATSAVVASSARHVTGLEQVSASLDRAREALSVSTLEVAAGELELALHALAEFTGRDASTELLDAIFQRLCIGQ